MVKLSRTSRIGIATLTLLTLGLLPASVVHAQVVAPNAYANTVGDTAINTLDQTSGRVIQTQIAASELTAFAIGANISGISFRLASGNAAPTVDQNFASYQVTLSQAVHALSSPTFANDFSDAFANNIGANAVTVYNSPLTFAASSYSSGATGTTPNAFGPTINFTTPYIYQGGDLVITIRHSGTGNTQAAPLLDSVGPNSPSYLKTVYTQVSTVSQTATNANAGGTTSIMRLNGAVVPEANSATLLGLALPIIGAVVVARRRSK